MAIDQSLPVKVRYPSPPAGLCWLRLLFQAGWTLAPEWTFRRLWRLFRTPRRPQPNAWEAAALAGARRGTVAGPVGPVAVYEWGEPAWPAVVLVHGWEHRAAFWSAWIAPLLAAGYRVVALDAPAHGVSAGRQVDMVGFAGAVGAVLAHAGTLHAVVAHSFGAASVAGLPVSLPAAGGRLPRLILLSAPPGPLVIANRFAALLRLPAALVTRMAHHYQVATGRDIRSFSVAVAGPTLGAEQVLLVHDEQDPIVPIAEARQLAAAWPAAHFVRTQGLGHNRILREPGVVRQAVYFLLTGHPQEPGPVLAS